MTKDQSIKAVRAYVKSAWPVSSTTRDGSWRAAWAQSRIANIGLELFRELVANEGYQPVHIGEVYLLRFPGPSKRLADGAIRCEGL